MLIFRREGILNAMPRRALKVGIAQIPVVMGDKRGNRAVILDALAGAAAERCDVAVFPECSLAGWCSPAARKAAEPIPGPFTRRLAREAARRRIAVVIGLEERDGPRLHNSAVLIDRRGKLLLRHRKVNELEIGLKLYARGTGLGVTEFEGRTAGLSICADSWEPEITDGLYGLGARIIFSPSAWAADPGGEGSNAHWIGETYRMRTRGRNLTIIAADGVGPVTQGPWKGRVLQGTSMVYRDGRQILRGPVNRAALLTVRV